MAGAGRAIAVIALIDGEHHPAAVRDELDRLDAERGLAGVVFVGGGEKLTGRPDWGRPVRTGDPEEALRALAADAGEVVDLADEPVLRERDRLRLAALALHLGLSYEAPGLRLEPPPAAPLDTDARVLAVIGTGKRTGKTAVAGHWARLLNDLGAAPVILSMGRGGPAAPQLASADTSLDDLLAIADGGGHAASDYLEDAVLAGVPSVGCRRVGGGPAGVVGSTGFDAAVRLATEGDPDVLIMEGSGATIPPARADRTVCVVGDREGADGLGRLRLLRADLCLVAAPWLLPLCPGEALELRLDAEPVEPVPDGARVALFTTGATACAGVEPVLVSPHLAAREALVRDLDRAEAEDCDLYLTELKAAAIDTVATRARERGVEVGFVRNRPTGPGVDEALVRLYRDA